MNDFWLQKDKILRYNAKIRFKFNVLAQILTQSDNSEKNPIFCIWCNKNISNFALNAKKIATKKLKIA